MIIHRKLEVIFVSRLVVFPEFSPAVLLARIVVTSGSYRAVGQLDDVRRLVGMPVPKTLLQDVSVASVRPGALALDRHVVLLDPRGKVKSPLPVDFTNLPLTIGACRGGLGEGDGLEHFCSDYSHPHTSFGIFSVSDRRCGRSGRWSPLRVVVP